MSDAPGETTYQLSAGAFRGLVWPGGAGTAIFLHGLSGVADVWQQTVAALGVGRPECIAIDQRGHGRSPKPEHDYSVTSYLRDLLDLVMAVGGPVHLVGHSMGARVAMVAAARHPGQFRSVAIVDIGPEAWRANITESVAAFERMPRSFADRDAALEYGSRGRGGSLDAERFLLPRLRETPGGHYTWLASREALIETVTLHRSHSYWAEWEAISIPALLVRGERSNELRPVVAAQMRERNPRVEFKEVPDVGHNIPPLAPDALAAELKRFWARLGAGRE
jgi:pimeloyl-ACP methyl ester carboxylesterase